MLPDLAAGKKSVSFRVYTPRAISLSAWRGMSTGLDSRLSLPTAG